MKKVSWSCTFITQLSLFISAYVVLNIGQPQKHIHGNSLSRSTSVDMYFISVAGGFRQHDEQTLLLQMMAKVAKAYKARFVVDISELGESDPLLQNATRYPDLHNVPWFTTGALVGKGDSYFSKKIKNPSGQALDIIIVDTVLFQNMSSELGHGQIQWLKRTLQECNGNWRIVVGFHHLISCDNNILDAEEAPTAPLHNMLLHYGVDAYLSRPIFAGHTQGGATGLIDLDLMDKSLVLTAMNRDLAFKRENFNGFLLHCVSSMEMETFYVKLTGEVVHKVALKQRGKAVM